VRVRASRSGTRRDRLSRPVLLVVDNADSTDQIVRLLPAGQVHRALITSRRAPEG
jgi:hypothetical protein